MHQASTGINLLQGKTCITENHGPNYSHQVKNPLVEQAAAEQKNDSQKIEIEQQTTTNEYFCNTSEEINTAKIIQIDTRNRTALQSAEAQEISRLHCWITKSGNSVRMTDKGMHIHYRTKNNGNSVLLTQHQHLV